ncbi:uncharacterized protein Dvar_56700 [Desulfosarcina variabilis str. Montpellier]
MPKNDIMVNTAGSTARKNITIGFDTNAGVSLMNASMAATEKVRTADVIVVKNFAFSQILSITNLALAETSNRNSKAFSGSLMNFGLSSMQTSFYEVEFG